MSRSGTATHSSSAAFMLPRFPSHGGCIAPTRRAASPGGRSGRIWIRSPGDIHPGGQGEFDALGGETPQEWSASSGVCSVSIDQSLIPPEKLPLRWRATLRRPHARTSGSPVLRAARGCGRTSRGVGELGRHHQDGGPVLAEGVDEVIDSDLAPTSMPLVGSSSRRTCGRCASQRPRTTFCWFPPESVRSGASAPAARAPADRTTGRPLPSGPDRRRPTGGRAGDDHGPVGRHGLLHGEAVDPAILGNETHARRDRCARVLSRDCNPLISTFPVRGSRPCIERSRVDRPDPTNPAIPTTSPPWTSRSTPSSDLEPSSPTDRSTSRLADGGRKNCRSSDRPTMRRITSSSSSWPPVSWR